jgi:AraC-like DNA-binding protein
MMTESDMAKIRRLVGTVTREQLRFVECFVGDRVALFIPSVGPCFYAVTPDHAHPAYSFILTFDDETRMAVEGKIITSKPGLVLAVDPDAVHHELAADEPPRYIGIFIERDFFECQLRIYPGIPDEPFAFRSFPPGPELISLLKDIMNEAEAGLPGRDSLLEAIGTRIAHSLIRAAFAFPPISDRLGARLDIHRAIEYLHGHYAEKVTVAGLARFAAMSTSHLSRTFRQETGHPPLDYLIRLRLQKSRLLLRAGDDTITTIALKCGFASHSHFTACYQRHFGISPSEYQKKIG